VAPLVALSLRPGNDRLPAAEPLWLDVAVFLVALAPVIALLFSVDSETGERLLYLLFVPLIVIAMRRGFAGAVFGVAIVQVAIVTSLWLAGRTADDAASYQMLMIVLGVTTLFLGAVAGERRRAITELARRSAELRAQQQALADAMRVSAASETAATLTHEMSQPLSAIGTYAHALREMIKKGRSSSADLTGIIERIVAESARTRDSVQRIRDFFRSGSARREAIELGVVVDDTVEALRDRMRAEAISLVTDVPATLPPVSADRIQLGIVLLNLVGNAADAQTGTLPPRWIRITARERDAFVEVEVADGGPGIDASVRDVLFEPLATTKPAGMGLGLPISRTLILAHGGRLELASLHPTTFRFSLPTHGNLLQ
jgi:C4-dicarboxylate-specific signal transduction histidine kinase